MPKPRFTLVLHRSIGGPLYCHREYEFFTLQGLEQWLANARATGEVSERDKVSVYDDSGCRL